MAATRTKTATSRAAGWELPAGHKILLLLLRHAKSDWDSGAVDSERPLNRRGQRDAVAVGERIAGQGLVPDLVVCSTALRNRQTWDRAVVGGCRAHEVRYLDQIYQASVFELLGVVRDLPEEAKTVLLIGHSPGVPDLGVLLVADAAESSARTQLEEKYPTAGLAVLTLPGPWAAAGRDRASLVAFEVLRR